MIVHELRERRLVQLVQDVAELLFGSAPLGEVLAVHLAQRANQRVAMLLAQLTVLVAMQTVQTWLFQEYLPGERRPFRPPRYNARERLSVAEAIGYAPLRPIHRGLSYARGSSIALLELLHRSPGHRRALAFWSLKGGSLFLEALPG